MFNHPPTEFCPGCGQALAELVNSGTLGCGLCLFHFPVPAEQLVMRSQNGAYQHLGDWPLRGSRLFLERAQVYRAAISRAAEEGRTADVEALVALLQTLEGTS